MKNKPPTAGRGRPKGSPNKMTALAKDAIAYAAQGLGGADRLMMWAKESEKNEHAFWTQVYTKLLPLQVNAELSGKVVSEVAWNIRGGPGD